jgi:hypothetical protein
MTLPLRNIETRHGLYGGNPAGALRCRTNEIHVGSECPRTCDSRTQPIPIRRRAESMSADGAPASGHATNQVRVSIRVQLDLIAGVQTPALRFSHTCWRARVERDRVLIAFVGLRVGNLDHQE